MVGGPTSNPFVFTPPNVTAAVGDIVMFTFSGVYVLLDLLANIGSF